jgi:hypothetical protein
MQIFPNTGAPFTNKLGRILRPWIQYLQQFTQAPPSVIGVTVSASPFAYTAKEPGFIFVNGGTVSNISFARGSIVLNFTGQKLVPVSINDIVTVTYSVLPTISFIPIYGAVPG